MDARAERPCLKGPRPSGEELLHLPSSAVGHEGTTAYSRKRRPPAENRHSQLDEWSLKILIFATEGRAIHARP